ncbi:MAG: Spx/MgsR family RNA polymerase-binding regulatory protein [bacterium]
MLKIYYYAKCGTCRKAKKWLDGRRLKSEVIDITLHPPSVSQLKDFLKKSGLPLKNFLNTSGEQYRALGMKEKVKTLPEERILEMMAGEGRLLKRPIVTDSKKVTVGYDEKNFASHWG